MALASSKKCRYQIHAMKPQTAFEVKPVFESQKNWGCKPKETGISQPTYPCRATQSQRCECSGKQWVMDGREQRQLIWKGCWWHLTSRVLFTEWKNPVVMKGLCVLSSACEAERKSCLLSPEWGLRWWAEALEQPDVRMILQPDVALLSWERLPERTWDQNSAFAIHVAEGWFCPHRFLTRS